MTGYVKIFGSILGSSVWSESAATRIVWITMLAMADQNGHVEASVSGLARFANVSPAQCRAAIDALSAPDPDSKSPEFEGRRIEKDEGGWAILNYLKYRDLRSQTQIQTAARQQRWRDRQASQENSQNVTERDAALRNDGKRTTASASVSVLTTRSTTSVDLLNRSAPEEREVLEHYLATHPRRRVSERDRKAVAKALALGYAPSELREAIDGNATDEWHVEKKKHELPYVLRDTGKIDDFRARAKRSPPKPMVDPDTGILTLAGMDAVFGKNGSHH